MRARLATLKARGRHLALGGLATLAVCAATAVLSFRPEWQSVPEDAALIRLSFAHSGPRVCRDRTAEELAALPPNMRAPQVCERRRAPVRIELDLDGAPVLARDLAPSGLAGSGPSRIYARLVVPAGRHAIALRLREDPAAASGFTHDVLREVTLVPGQNLAIDFRGAAGEFIFH